MRNSRLRITGMQRVLIAALLVHTGPLAAQETTDFSGVWDLDGSATSPWPLDPPWSPEGQAAQDAWAAAPLDDPAHLCLFHLWRIASAPLPFEIIQQDGRLTILYEYQHQIRRVYVDGRDHPDNEYPTLMGHSIGEWDGATLVVDTTGVDSGYMRPQGLPHTAQAHFIERYTLIEDGQRMRQEITIDDPAYYREPWNVTLFYARFDGEIRDYDCIVRPHVPGQ